MSEPDKNDIAAKWLVDLEMGDRTPEMWAEFRRWLNEEQQNIDVFLKVEQAWRALGYLWKLSPNGRVINPTSLPQVDTEEINDSLTS